MVLVREHERECGKNYSWIVKARPDIVTGTDVAKSHIVRWLRQGRPPPPFEAQSMSNIGFKDKSMGDGVIYLPRPRLPPILSLLDANKCESLLPELNCSRPENRGCKCNYIFAVLAKRVQLNLSFHDTGVSIIRTREAMELAESAMVAYGKSKYMQHLHNVLSWDDAVNTTIEAHLSVALSRGWI